MYIIAELKMQSFKIGGKSNSVKKAQKVDFWTHFEVFHDPRIS